jgi:hypothetical protein
VSDPLAADGLWAARHAALAEDLRRVAVLSTPELVDPAIAIRLGKLLDQLQIELNKLRAQLAPGDVESWRRLALVRGQVRSLTALVLALSAGSAIDPIVGGGATLQQVQRWLDNLRARAFLERPLLVAYGAAASYEPFLGVAFYPFLDRNPWWMPPMARAVGLHAADMGRAAERLLLQPATLLGAAPPALDRLPHTLAASARQLRRDYLTGGAGAQAAFEAAHAARLSEFQQAQRAFLQALLADMYAVAVAGPVYAMAALTLEIDYQHPDHEPSPGEPAPVYRVAAMLAMLQRLALSEEHPAAVANLRSLWAGALTSVRVQDNLPLVERSLAEQLKTLATLEVLPDLGGQIEAIGREWRDGELWYEAMSGQPKAPPRNPSPTARCTAVWRFMLDYPAYAGEVDSRLGSLAGGRAVDAVRDRPAEWRHSYLRIRRLRLRERADQLQLLVEARADDGLVAVAGRFTREIGRLYTALRQNDTARRPWAAMPAIEAADHSLRAEALEFFGSRRLIDLGADWQNWPPEGRLRQEPAPGICALADRMLRRYARLTGVNWSGRTILGADPELETRTDLIRLRFPDWSPWSLPLMTHEFGHLVALDTPEFLALHRSLIDGVGRVPPEALQKVKDTGPDRLDWLQRRGRHLHELFADIFATLALGPAFAAATLLNEFEPAAAHQQRGAHPTHSERAEVILEVLAAMSVRDHRAYDEWHSRLRASWQGALTRAGVGGPINPAQHGQTLEWGRQIYHSIVQPIYGLGVGYTSERWKFARNLAERLVNDRQIGRDTLGRAAEATRAEAIVLDDLLSALWCARVMYAPDKLTIEKLESRSYDLVLLV